MKKATSRIYILSMTVFSVVVLPGLCVSSRADSVKQPDEQTKPQSKPDDLPPISKLKIPEPYKPGTGPKPTMTLSEAIDANDIEQVRRHISHGISLDAPNEDGVVPLFQVLRQNPDEKIRPEIMIMLVRAGADISIKAEEFDDRSPLHFAAYRGPVDTIKTLLDAGAEVNGKCKLDWTPLHDAAFEGNAKAVKLLLAAGAQLDAKNHE